MVADSETKKSEDYTTMWLPIVTTTRDTSELIEKMPIKEFSGKCRFCGKWQSGLLYHEEKVCPKRFRR